MPIPPEDRYTQARITPPLGEGRRWDTSLPKGSSGGSKLAGRVSSTSALGHLQISHLIPAPHDQRLTSELQRHLGPHRLLQWDKMGTQETCTTALYSDTSSSSPLRLSTTFCLFFLNLRISPHPLPLLIETFSRRVLLQRSAP